MTTATAPARDRAATEDARPAARWDTACFAAFLALLAWLPVPLGSNRTWALALAALGVWALLAVWTACALGAGATQHLQRLRRAAPCLAVLGALAALPALQLAAPALGLPAELATRDAFATRSFLLAALAHAGVALLVVLFARTPRRLAWMLGAVVAAALVQAVLAVGLATARASYLYLFTEFGPGGRASGTFANPDHLAGYMELGLSAGIGLLVALYGGAEGTVTTVRARGLAVLAFLLSPTMLLRVALVVLVVALVMTHSRMGNGAFFLSMLLVGAVVAVASRRLRRPALWLVASMVVIDLIVIGQWVGLDKVVDRIQDTVVATRDDARRAREGADTEALAIVAPAAQTESLQDRLQLPFAAWPLAQQRPWLGHGGGTFRLVAAPAKPGDLEMSQLYWDYAHNDYVQTAVETGYTGLALWLLLGAATAWRAARLLADRQPRTVRGVGVAGLMALSCLGLHSWVDFNLQIPANAATLTLLVALVWAAPMAAPRRAASGRARSTPAGSPAAEAAPG